MEELPGSINVECLRTVLKDEDHVIEIPRPCAFGECAEFFRKEFIDGVGANRRSLGQSIGEGVEDAALGHSVEKWLVTR